MTSRPRPGGSMDVCGNEPVSGMYFEVLGRGAARPPVLMIHGGGATGGCFRSDLRGGGGWADGLAVCGHEVWVTDWPACGRSGGRQLDTVGYADVVAGYRRLLQEVIARPVVVVCHSMGGATAWQLVEHEPALVVGVVAVAAASPGNTAPVSEILAEDGDVVTIRFGPSGAEFVIDRRRGYLYEDDYVYRQAIATSARFPSDRVAAMRASFVPMPPRMLLQRLGVETGLPVVENQASFAGKPVRLLAGPEDPAHTREIEDATAALLRSWGADARTEFLEDRGILGNGHFLMWEDNQAEVLSVLAELIDDVSR